MLSDCLRATSALLYSEVFKCEHFVSGDVQIVRCFFFFFKLRKAKQHLVHDLATNLGSLKLDV